MMRRTGKEDTFPCQMSHLQARESYLHLFSLLFPSFYRIEVWEMLRTFAKDNEAQRHQQLGTVVGGHLLEFP